MSDFTITAPASALAALLKGVPTGPAAKVSPIYGCALIDVRDGVARVTTTDSVVTMTRSSETADMTSVEGEGTVALPRATLDPLLSKFDRADQVTLRAAGPDATLTCGRARYRIAGRDAADFPPLDAYAGATGTVSELDADHLIAALQRVRISAARDAVKAALMGVNVTPRPNGRAIFAALDGIAASITHIDDMPVHENGVTIPISTVDVIVSSISGLVTVETSETFIRIAGPGLSMTSSVVGDGFPDYVPIFQRAAAARRAIVSVARDRLLAALDRLGIVAEQVGDHRQLRFTAADGVLTISSGAGQAGDGDERLDCIIKGEAVEWLLQPKRAAALVAAGSSDTAHLIITSDSPAKLMQSDGDARDVISGMRG